MVSTFHLAALAGITLQFVFAQNPQNTFRSTSTPSVTNPPAPSAAVPRNCRLLLVMFLLRPLLPSGPLGFSGSLTRTPEPQQFFLTYALRSRVVSLCRRTRRSTNDVVATAVVMQVHRKFCRSGHSHGNQLATEPPGPTRKHYGLGPKTQQSLVYRAGPH